MHATFSRLQNNLWITLFIAPAILLLVPETILWWWPGNPPRWAPVAAAMIGLLVNILCLLAIRFERKSLSAAERERASWSLNRVWRATIRRRYIFTVRSTFQTINALAGIVALVHWCRNGGLVLRSWRSRFVRIFGGRVAIEESAEGASPDLTVVISTLTPLAVRSDLIGG